MGFNSGFKGLIGRESLKIHSALLSSYSSIYPLPALPLSALAIAHDWLVFQGHHIDQHNTMVSPALELTQPVTL